VSGLAYVTELRTEGYTEGYTEGCDPEKMLGRRVRVLDDELNPKGVLGAWYVTRRDPANTAHVIVTKVDEHRVQEWSIHHGLLRVRP